MSEWLRAIPWLVVGLGLTVVFGSMAFAGVVAVIRAARQNRLGDNDVGNGCCAFVLLGPTATGFLLITLAPFVGNEPLKVFGRVLSFVVGWTAVALVAFIIGCGAWRAVQMIRNSRHGC